MPRYRVSERYIRSVNLSNTYVDNTYITNVFRTREKNIQYVNQHAPGAVTTVASRPTMASRPSVSQATWANERDDTAPRERENDALRASFAARPQEARDDREQAVDRPVSRSADTKRETSQEPREARPVSSDSLRGDQPPQRRNSPRSEPPQQRRDTPRSDPPRRDQPPSEARVWNQQQREDRSRR